MISHRKKNGQPKLSVLFYCILSYPNKTSTASIRQKPMRSA